VLAVLDSVDFCLNIYPLLDVAEILLSTSLLCLLLLLSRAEHVFAPVSFERLLLGLVIRLLALDIVGCSVDYLFHRSIPNIFLIILRMP
jgi:hypothetical protein